jgi:hypothetical protein
VVDDRRGYQNQDDRHQKPEQPNKEVRHTARYASHEPVSFPARFKLCSLITGEVLRHSL